MRVESQPSHIISQPEPKRSGDVSVANELALQVSPASKLWFYRRQNKARVKVVANPNIELRCFTPLNMQTALYFREFLPDWSWAPPQTGISAYIMAPEDKTTWSQYAR